MSLTSLSHQGLRTSQRWWFMWLFPSSQAALHVWEEWLNPVWVLPITTGESRMVRRALSSHKLTLFYYFLISPAPFPFSKQTFFSSVPGCLPSNPPMTNLHPLLRFKPPACSKWKIRELLVPAAEPEMQVSATGAFQQQVTILVLLRSEKARRLTKGY